MSIVFKLSKKNEENRHFEDEEKKKFDGVFCGHNSLENYASNEL